MNKWIKHYQASIFLFIALSLLTFCYFFVASISRPNELDFLSYQSQVTHHATFMYDYQVPTSNFDFLKNNHFEYIISLSGNGIAMIIVLLIFHTSFFYFLGLSIKLKLVRQTLVFIVLVSLFYFLIIYLFIVSSVQTKIGVLLNQIYYDYQRIIVNHLNLTAGQKVELFSGLIEHYNLATINDSTSMLNQINDAQVMRPIFFYNGSYSFANNYYATGLIYFTYTISAIFFVVMVIFYLIQTIQFINLLPIKEKPAKQRKYNPNKLNIDRSKKNKKQMIAVPDADLERIFQELDL
ncbi:hypothetical protein OF375_01365 [Ureaplasma miroungigenitalium]|uniref:hypothetical protein n=1 Tax=Ureaplasma miroungigenitalium TaxID=1042321 RepID=UPI0021E83797|nr:hypothetical protein [Ureaplasma miroungigenitalium]MCV3734218.1 hypothetical protein [Ureaplasma miroungigenitalium]